MTLPSAISLLQYALGAVAFIVLATANGAGYRYGASDQAFYIPVVARAVDPALFPRDASLIDAQGRLMVVDEILGGLVRTTAISVEAWFLIGYLVSVALVGAGLVLIGTRVYRSPWAIAALAAGFTMRHQISRTSANSFEPYFHPRMLAFGLGVLAVAAVLRRRAWTAIVLVGVSALIHITTALWFAILIGIALAVLDVRLRRFASSGAAGAVMVLIWAVTGGPLRGAISTMDAIWREAVSSKDSLFATDWPVWAWVANLGLLVLLWWAHRTRVRRGDATPEDAALVWGATGLAALFLVTLPFVAAGISLAVQFQISRVFWLIDFIALVYVIGAIAGSPPKGGHYGQADVVSGVSRAGSPPEDGHYGQADVVSAFRRTVADLRSGNRRAVAVALVLLTLATIRGTYVMVAEHPTRTLFEVRLRDSQWEDAMRWLGRQPRALHVLADPGHAWKYGTSVRVSAERDVLVEEVKDSALAIYSRDVASRFVDRTRALGDFTTLTADRARTLARQYELDVLVTEADLPLPLAYRNAQFRIYSLH